MAGPLAGLTVVDLSRGAAGAITTMVLADYGARVIKVDPPGEDAAARFPGYRAWGRGKESVHLDLRSGADRLALERLLAGADVLVESFAPGRAAAFGLGRDELCARQPHLVQCSLTGYGQAGSWRDRPGYDSLVSARLGLMDVQPGYRAGPIFLGFPMATYGAAFLAVIGTLAAVYAREATGRGQQVDVSLFDGALALSSMGWWWTEQGLPAVVVGLPRADIPDLFRSTLRLIYGLFRCADGEYLQINTGARGAFGRAMALFGLRDRVQPAVSVVEKAEPLSEEEAALVWSEIPRLLATRPRAEWLERLWAADIAALPVLRPGEALEDDQVRFNGLVLTLDDPVLGRVKQIGPPVRFSRTPPRVSGSAPRPGEHTEKVLAELRRGGGRGGEEIERAGAPGALGEVGELGAPRHALEGVKLLDFGHYFAGPFASKTLADLGAEVIKVEA